MEREVGGPRSQGRAGVHTGILPSHVLNDNVTTVAVRDNRERARLGEVDAGPVVVPEEVADGLRSQVHAAREAELDPRVRVQRPVVRDHGPGLWGVAGGGNKGREGVVGGGGGS